MLASVLVVITAVLLAAEVLSIAPANHRPFAARGLAVVQDEGQPLRTNLIHSECQDIRAVVAR